MKTIMQLKVKCCVNSTVCNCVASSTDGRKCNIWKFLKNKQDKELMAYDTIKQTEVKSIR